MRHPKTRYRSCVVKMVSVDEIRINRRIIAGLVVMAAVDMLLLGVVSSAPYLSAH